MDTLDLLLHPVRLRIVHAMSGGRILTTSDLCTRLPDVPKTTVYRHVALLKDFRYLSLQHGPREGTARVFVITPGSIEEIAGLIADPAKPGELLRLALERAAGQSAERLDQTQTERVGIVTHHLFSAKHRGVCLRLDTIVEKAVVKGFKELRKQTPQEEIEGEGVMKELQAL